MTIMRTIFHGTTFKRAKMMLRHGVAFTPLFVCNEFATALHYAKCRAASDIDAKVDPSAVPAVFMLEVPSQHLSMDDYSEHEPGQWKIDQPDIWLRNGNLQAYTEGWPPANEVELLHLVAFSIGMSKYLLDDRKVTPVGKVLLGY